MNLYFLMIACLQLWNIITPVNPVSTWAPLIFIFAISALKEGFDDFHRHVRDREANHRPCYIIQDGRRKQVRCQDIRVGDIVYLTKDCEVPCDLVLVASADAEGCYIEVCKASLMCSFSCLDSQH